MPHVEPAVPHVKVVGQVFKVENDVTANIGYCQSCHIGQEQHSREVICIKHVGSRILSV